MSRHHQHNPEHGTMTSYVIGFILSLIFTFIPYYMVVNQTVAGSALLVTILGFAVIQMIIQILFFLHLGRGPKPLYNVAFFVSTVGIILVVVAGSIVIISNLHYRMSVADQKKVLINDEGIYQINGQATGACQGQHDNHQITLNDDTINPVHTYADKCDTLTFVNEDITAQKIMFGQPEQPTAYAGLSDITARDDRNKTITLSESGSYRFYSESNQEISGFLTVAE